MSVLQEIYFYNLWYKQEFASKHTQHINVGIDKIKIIKNLYYSKH